MKKMKLNYIFKGLCIFFLGVQVVLGQTTPLPTPNFKPDLLPVSPTAASLGKYVDVPVSLYTGTPNISVPIYNIEANDIKIPISLSYHAGGHRVEEISSWVGLGWSLQATGVINRAVRGKIDNTSLNPAYWYKNKFANQGDNYNVMLNPEVTADYTLLSRLAEGLVDPSPDIYTFNFLGYSGKFIVTDKITMIPQQPFKIVPYNNDGTGNAFDRPTGFKITTDDGTEYTFFQTEYARIKNESISYETSFYLSSIKSQKSTIVNFEYNDYIQNNRNIGYSESSYYKQTLGSSQYSQEGTLTTSTNTVKTYGKTLKRIVFPNGSVEFIAVNDRLDFTESRLDKILIKDSGGRLTKKVKLNQSYFSDVINLLNKRLKLESIVELDPTLAQETTGITHSFNYEEQINLPERYSKSIDHWGFYNGKNNTYLSPILNAQYTCKDPLDISNREVDDQYSYANILKKITYPTGGTASFDFESNSYLDLSPSNNRTTTAVEAVTGEISEQFFNVIGFYCSEIISNITRPSDEVAGATKTCYANLYKIGTNGIRTFIIGFSYPTNNGSHSITLDEGQYVLSARTNIPNAIAAASINYISSRDLFTNKKCGGIRIKKISLYDGILHSNDIIKTFKYELSNDALKSSGVLFSFPEYAIFGTANVLANIGCSFPQCCVYEVGDIKLNSGNLISQGSDNIVGYKEVTIFFQGGTSPFKSISSFSTDSYGFQDSDISWKRGLLTKQVDYNSDNKPVHEVTNLYDGLPIGTDPNKLSEVFGD